MENFDTGDYTHTQRDSEIKIDPTFNDLFSRLVVAEIRPIYDRHLHYTLMNQTNYTLIKMNVKNNMWIVYIIN